MKMRLPDMFVGLVIASLSVFIGCGQILQNKNLPLAIKGVLDLSDWDFEQDGPVDLSGEYEFYWQQHLAPESFSQAKPPERSGFMKVPAYWKGYELNGMKLPGTGHATYRLTILLKDSISQKLAFKFLDMGTAYTVFANGEKILSVGTAGQTPETTSPRYFPQVVDFALDSNRIELIYQVSNFHHTRGGAWELIHLGTVEQINDMQEKRLTPDLILFGSILVMGLYHLALFSLRKNDRSLFFFGLFCLLIAVRLLTTVEKYLLHIFPGMSWELLVKVEYLSIYLAGPVFALFLYRLFSHDFHKPVIAAILAIGLPFSGIVSLTRARIFTQTLHAYELFIVTSMVYALFMLVLCTVRKRDGAAIILLGFLFLSATIVNDILDVAVIIQTGHFVHLGLFIFIFAHAFMLSARSARAFGIIDLQRGELEKSNLQYQKEVMEHKQTEEAWRAGETRFRTLVETMNDGLAQIDANFTITYVNEKLCQMTGYAKEEFVGRQPDAFHDETNRQTLHEQMALRKQDIEQPYEIEIKCKDGHNLPVIVSPKALYDGAGNFAGSFAVFTDISRRKQEERALRNANEKLVQEIQERERAERKLKRSQEDLRNLSAHLENLREEERTRMAREIHDELGQALSTLKMDLGTLENHFPKDKKILFEITHSMAELIYLTIQRVKRISQELRPSVLDHLTFPQAVAWQVEEFMKTTGISCQLAIRNAEDLQLAPNASNALFRVLQEALTNIIRHAEATRVVVALEKTDAHMRLKIQDNGKGIANKEMTDPQSFGLIGMRERIHHLNGKIEIKSGKNQGTTIVCTIPTTQASNGP